MAHRSLHSVSSGYIQPHQLMSAYSDDFEPDGRPSMEDDRDDDESLPMFAPLFQASGAKPRNGRPVDDEHLQRQLLADCANGNERALAELHRLMSHRIYNFVYPRLRNSYDAENVVVDTLFQVWKSAHKYRGDSSVRVWILGIAKYKVMELTRKQQHIKLMRDDDGEEQQAQLVDPDFNPMDHMLSEQEMLEAMNDLTPSQIDCIYLVHFEGLACGEVANLLDINLKTVNSHLSQGLKKWINGITKRCKR